MPSDQIVSHMENNIKKKAVFVEVERVWKNIFMFLNSHSEVRVYYLLLERSRHKGISSYSQKAFPIKENETLSLHELWKEHTLLY